MVVVIVTPTAIVMAAVAAIVMMTATAMVIVMATVIVMMGCRCNTHYFSTLGAQGRFLDSSRCSFQAPGVEGTVTAHEKSPRLMVYTLCMCLFTSRNTESII